MTRFSVSIQAIPRKGEWFRGVRDPHRQEPFPPATLFEKLTAMGCSVVRLFVDQTAYANPSRGVFVLDEIAEMVGLISAAGLLVYFSNTGRVPAWIAPGYDGSCSAKDGVTMDLTRPECVNPGHIDPGLIREWAVALASHPGIGPYVWCWSPINEPGTQSCWTPSMTIGQDIPLTSPENYARRAVIEMAIPFCDGVLSVIPDAMLVGPEACAGYDIGDVLAVEFQPLNLVKRGGFWQPVFDAIAYHPYAWGGSLMEQALARVDAADGFRAAAAPYLNGREEWWSEFSVDSGHDPLAEIPPFVEEAIRRGVGLVNLHEIDHLFLPGTGRWEGWTAKDQSFRPGPLYERLKGILKPVRRRVGPK